MFLPEYQGAQLLLARYEPATLGRLALPPQRVDRTASSNDRNSSKAAANGIVGEDRAGPAGELDSDRGVFWRRHRAQRTCASLHWANELATQQTLRPPLGEIQPIFSTLEAGVEACASTRLAALSENVGCGDGAYAVCRGSAAVCHILDVTVVPVELERQRSQDTHVRLSLLRCLRQPAGLC